MRGFLFLSLATATFFKSVQKQLGCQYACSLIPDCVSGDGSICDDSSEVCSGISRTLEGFCYNCGEVSEPLTCDEAMQGLIASLTTGPLETEAESFTPPNENSSEEDWVLGFIPDWLKPGK